MEVKRVKLIYFSPTGTTQKVLESVAKGFTGDKVEHINLTHLEGVQQTISLSSDELVIIGAPVYGGRLPLEAINRFKRIKASQTSAILIVVYGNREFDDALLELKNLAIELGLNPIAAGAFIGEHSVSTKEVPIGHGRPDSLDVQKAMDFGKKIRDKITALQSPEVQMDLEIPGSFPYKTPMQFMAVSPISKEDTCTFCGTCAAICPTAAISINDNVATKTELCIRCCACIKNCPTGARVWEDEILLKTIAKWLNDNCSTRKEPQIFGMGG
jgi:ferredoxin